MLALTAASGWSAPIEYTDLASFNAAVGSPSVVGFTGFANGTPITNQYVGQGLTFSGASVDLDTIYTDGAGIFSTLLIIQFSSTIDAIAVDYPGAIQFSLYDGASLVYTSSQFGGSGLGLFAGVTGVNFDRVEMQDYVDNNGYVDNVYFGTTETPEPSSALLLLAALPAIVIKRRLAQKQNG
jgi:hypothetical protein